MKIIKEDYVLIHRDDLRNFRRVHFLTTVVNAILIIVICAGIALAWHGVVKIMDGAGYQKEMYERAAKR